MRAGKRKRRAYDRLKRLDCLSVCLSWRKSDGQRQNECEGEEEGEEEGKGMGGSSFSLFKLKNRPTTEMSDGGAAACVACEREADPAHPLFPFLPAAKLSGL